MSNVEAFPSRRTGLMDVVWRRTFNAGRINLFSVLDHDVDRTEDSLDNAQLWLRSETLKTSVAGYAGGWANAEGSELVKMDRLRKRDRGKRWLKDTFTFSRSPSAAPSHPNLSGPHTPQTTHRPNTTSRDAQDLQADGTLSIASTPTDGLVAQPEPTWGRAAASPLPITFAKTGIPNSPGAQKIAEGTSASSAEQQSLQSHVPGLPPIPVDLGTETAAQNHDVKQAVEGPIQDPSGRIIPFPDPSQGDTNTDHQNIDNSPSEAIIKQQSPGRKFYEGMKTTLRTIERVSDVFPPLKSTAAALLVICETIDAYGENLEEFERLLKRVEILYSIMESWPEDASQDAKDRFSGLSRQDTGRHGKDFEA
ncbi:hypothetical protein DFP72DRAFT_840503 [Ephemerocybe angulata]|uniref:Uncharacterized protein n=1 Tax=Ephemerocybe angulata TaxID=980116 RepID=A0A8H6IF87_9AGAR|nr:hypothetical protein DFP72DRAFT_840503 [Tulosesus angulatus]